MNKISLFILVLFSLFFTSCVPNKDLIYLQDKGEKVSAPIVPIQQKPYRLQISDIIIITVYAIDQKSVEVFNIAPSSMQTEQASYFGGYSIDDHGNIRMPLLGEVNVLGFTVDEVRQEIEKRLLNDYYKKEAGIFVTVKLSGFRYTINGEINNPGTRVLYQTRVNIMEAIANSGDVTVTGNRKEVKVIRRFPQGNEVFSIDLTDSNAVNSPAYFLQPNDYVYIKPLKQKSWGTGKTGVESLTALLTIFTLATTTFLILRN
jgi:polysaccharide biosynthesis/export protein